MADERPTTPLLTDDIRELLQLMKDSDFAELEIKRGDARVHIKRAAPPAPIMLAPAAPAGYGLAAPVPGAALPVAAPAAPAAPAPPAAPSGETVAAPMVGTFYAAPTPKDPPYVRVGDEVRPGDVLGIIEAMKIMNEIECELHGRVTQVLVESGQPVEYGQALLVIEPLD